MRSHRRELHSNAAVKLLIGECDAHHFIITYVRYVWTHDPRTVDRNVNAAQPKIVSSPFTIFTRPHHNTYTRYGRMPRTQSRNLYKYKIIYCNLVMEIRRIALGNSLLSALAAGTGATAATATTASAVPHCTESLANNFRILQTHYVLATLLFVPEPHTRATRAHLTPPETTKTTEDAYATVRVVATIWNNICVIRETLRAVILLSCLCNFIITILRSHSHAAANSLVSGTETYTQQKLSVFEEKFSVLHYYIIVCVRLCFAPLFRHSLIAVRSLFSPLHVGCTYVCDGGCVCHVKIEEFPSLLVASLFSPMPMFAVACVGIALNVTANVRSYFHVVVCAWFVSESRRRRGWKTKCAIT